MTAENQHAGQPGGHDAGGLVPVDDHLAELAGTIRPLAPIQLPLTEAEGCVVATDLRAGHPLPSFDNSAMDGYAVRASDVGAATERSPVVLPVAGEVAAGDTGAYGIAPGMCIRIMTGAQLPAGADAVVPVEWTDGGDTKVAIRRAAGRVTRSAGPVTTPARATCC